MKYLNMSPFKVLTFKPQIKKKGCILINKAATMNLTITGHYQAYCVQ